MIRGYSGILIGLGITGLALVILGTTATIPFWTSIGGALFGASLGSFVGRLAKKDLSEDIKKTVHKFLAPGLMSDESMIAPFRIKWHVYHVTRMDNQFIWRYEIVDFQNAIIPGHLDAETWLPDKTGTFAPYWIEGCMRDERLIMFFKAKGSQEPSGLFIFPFSGLKFGDKHFGILFHQTWDLTHSISPALISREPVFEELNEGTIPELVGQKLDILWQELMNWSGDLLPRIMVNLSLTLETMSNMNTR